MVISFLSVSGECVLAEAFTGGAAGAVHAGMTWKGMGPCVVTTGPTGKATIAVGERRLELGPNSWAKFGTGLSSIHKVHPEGLSVRHIAGHIWALVERNPSFDEDVHGNAVVGVRG